MELFFPSVATYLDPNHLTFLDKELFTDLTSGERREVDLVVKARFRNQDSFFLVHIENQSQPEVEFGQRMFHYFARLHEKYALPVYPIAIFSFDKPQRQEPQTYRVEFRDWSVLEFNYRVIQLNRLNWRDFLEQPNPVASALMAKMKIVPQDRPKVKAECLRLLATLSLDPARMQLISGFVDTYLCLNAAEENQFQAELSRMDVTEQEAIMEIVTSWTEQGIQQGIQQGVQQGIQQGVQQGEVALVMRQLSRRFGQISPELEQQIHRLSTDQLEALGEALLDFSDVTDLQSWLENYSEGQSYSGS